MNIWKRNGFEASRCDAKMSVVASREIHGVASRASFSDVVVSTCPAPNAPSTVSRLAMLKTGPS
jgi:hypothetical protein